MDYTTVDLMPWGKKNMALSPEGELSVRPGLVRVHSFLGESRTVVDGFSIFNAKTQESWHYVFYFDSSGELHLAIYDEDWTTLQTLAIPADRWPRVITHAVVSEVGQIIIASPDFQTIWGMVGSGVKFATKVESSTGLESVDIPRGLVAPWANRVVMASENLLFVGDPIAIDEGDARAFVGQNILSVDAPIIGLHNAQDDLLVIVTTDGVWGLPGEAATTAVIAASEGRLLRMQDYDGVSYGSSCEVRNQVFGLTRDGFRRLDVLESNDVRISDPVVCARQVERVSLSDYRDFQMLAGPDGPIITKREFGQVLYTNIGDGFTSWWTVPGGADVRGVLRRSDGEALLINHRYAMFIGGNYDGDYDVEANATNPVGSVLFRQPVEPAFSGVLRRVLLHTDSIQNVTMACRHKEHTETPPVQADVSIIGTSVWGSGGEDQLEAAMQTVRIDTAVRTDDIAIELSIRGAGRRLGRSVTLGIVRDARLTE